MSRAGNGKCRIEAADMPASPEAGAAWHWTLHPEDARLTQAVRLVWQWIPAGAFRMGARGYYPDEEPVHDRGIPSGFWMLETPVTQAQWLAVEGGENPAYEQHGIEWQRHPVERITWVMARDWCAGLRRAGEEVLKGWGAMLPTEAEWEYACRAGSRAEYCSGDGEENLERVGWYAGNSGGRTHPVKQKQPNAWGLYDMHGNVWEWCRNVWDANAYERFLETGKEPPDSADEGAPRAVRGGYFADRAVGCRSAYRNWRRPGLGGVGCGFRACLFPGPVPASHE